MNLLAGNRYSSHPPYVLMFLALAGLAFVYLSHMGYTPMDVESDEPYRGLVAREMMVSGDYITPTLNGELYLNKPPVYNWIIAMTFKLFGSYSMYVFRLPMFIGVCMLGWLTFYFTRKYTGDVEIAFFSAFALMTNGRILIYDSLLGLIDLTYAWVTFFSFMLVFYFGEKKQYWALFLSTYALCAVGFLMKGFSSLPFQGFTLLGYFIWRRQFLKLFHPAHFAGGALFLLITGAYYYTYFTRNDITLDRYFGNLLTESTKRTAFFTELPEFILHIFGYPLEMMYHYAPWFVLAILLVRKDMLRILKANPFVMYCAVAFFANILVYWLSPKVFARYIFMLLALAFVVTTWFYFRTPENDIRKKIIQWLFKGVVTIMFLAAFVLPFHPATNQIPGAWWKSALVILLFGGVTYGMWKQPRYFLYWFCLSLVVFRLTFNWYIVEQRGKRYFSWSKNAQDIAAIIGDQPLKILSPTYDINESDIGSRTGLTFNIMRQYDHIIPCTTEVDTTSFFLVHTSHLSDIRHTEYYSFMNFKATDSIRLVRFHEIIPRTFEIPERFRQPQP